MKDGEGNLATYEYDGHDRLLHIRYPVAARGAAASENYVDNLIAERAPGSSTVQRRHVFGPGTDEPIGQGARPPWWATTGAR